MALSLRQHGGFYFWETASGASSHFIKNHDLLLNLTKCFGGFLPLFLQVLQDEACYLLLTWSQERPCSDTGWVRHDTGLHHHPESVEHPLQNKLWKSAIQHKLQQKTSSRIWFGKENNLIHCIFSFRRPAPHQIVMGFPEASVAAERIFATARDTVLIKALWRTLFLFSTKKQSWHISSAC